MKRFFLVTMCGFFVLSCLHVSAETMPTETLEPVYEWQSNSSLDYLEFYPDVEEGKLPQVKRIIYAERELIGPLASKFRRHFYFYNRQGNEIKHFTSTTKPFYASPGVKYFIENVGDKFEFINVTNMENEILWSINWKEGLEKGYYPETINWLLTDDGRLCCLYCAGNVEEVNLFPESLRSFKWNLLVYDNSGKLLNSIKMKNCFCKGGFQFILSSDQKYAILTSKFFENDDITSEIFFVELEKGSLQVQKLFDGGKDAKNTPEEKRRARTSLDYILGRYLINHDSKLLTSANLGFLGEKRTFEFNKKSMQLCGIDLSEGKNYSFIREGDSELLVSASKELKIRNFDSCITMVSFQLPFVKSQPPFEFVETLFCDQSKKRIYLHTRTGDYQDTNNSENIYVVGYENILSRSSFKIKKKLILTTTCEKHDRRIQSSIISNFLIIQKARSYHIYNLVGK